MALSNAEPTQPIGARLNQHRVDVLGKGLREMATILGVAPAHLTDIEKGRRTPSEDLMLRIAKAYGIAEAQLRAGWSRADAIVSEVATQNAVNAEKVPAFLRQARDLTAEEWDALISQVNRGQTKRGRGRSR